MNCEICHRAEGTTDDRYLHVKKDEELGEGYDYVTRTRSKNQPEPEDLTALGPLAICPDCGQSACPDCLHEGDCCESIEEDLPLFKQG